MKETEFVELFDRYSKEVRVPVAKKRRRSSWPLKAALVTAAVGMIFAASVLLPRDSVAATLERVDAAISDADSMSMQMTISVLGKIRFEEEVFYEDGSWARRLFLGTNREVAFIDVDGRQYIHYTRHPYATVGAPMGIFEETDMTAIEYVKEVTDWGRMDYEREYTITTGPVIDGRSTYVITGTKIDGSYRSETIVDAATDLPIRTELRIDHGDIVDETHIEFTWNEQLPEGVFDPESFRVPIIDTEAGLRDLLDEWQEPIATVRDGSTETRLLDVKLSSTGEVYFVSSLHNDGDSRYYLMPTELHDDAGNEYRKLLEYDAAGVSRGSSQKQNGAETVITVFVPADTDRPANNLTIGWKRRQLYWTGRADDSAAVAGNPILTDVSPPARMETEFPEYSAVLFVDNHHLKTSFYIASLRAQTLLERGDYDGAVKWGWIAYERRVAWIPLVAYHELGTVIDALEASGRPDEANDVRKREAREMAEDYNR